MSIPGNFHENLTSGGQLYSVFYGLLTNFNPSIHKIIHKLPAPGFGVISIVWVKAPGVIHPIIDDVERVLIAVFQLISDYPVTRMLGELVVPFPADIHRHRLGEVLHAIEAPVRAAGTIAVEVTRPVAARPSAVATRFLSWTKTLCIGKARRFQY